MRLIDADKLMKMIPTEEYNARIAITYAPTVDAEPVRHGHWIFNPKDAIEMMFTLPKCSECGAESSNGGNYCSNCGAKMDAPTQKSVGNTLEVKDTKTNESTYMDKHGHWVKKWNTFFKQDVWHCDVCEKGSPLKYDYCPNCGTKMSEVEDEDS